MSDATDSPSLDGNSQQRGGLLQTQWRECPRSNLLKTAAQYQTQAPHCLHETKGQWNACNPGAYAISQNIVHDPAHYPVDTAIIKHDLSRITPRVLESKEAAERLALNTLL